MSPTEGVLLVAIGALAFLDAWPALQTMISRPVVVGPLVGWVLGAPAEGAFWGATFEALYLGLLPVGAASNPDASLAALVGTTIAVMTGDGETAPAAFVVATGLLAGRFGEIVDGLQRRWNGRLADRVRVDVEAGDPGAPGRGVALGLARAAVLGAGQAAIALGLALAAWGLVGGTPLAARVPIEWLAAAALAAAAVAGSRLFATRGRRGWLWGVGALAGIGAGWFGATG